MKSQRVNFPIIMKVGGAVASIINCYEGTTHRAYSTVTANKIASHCLIISMQIVRVRPMLDKNTTVENILSMNSLI